MFVIKHNADGFVDCYKARLMIKGYSQHLEFDYVETFASTVRMATIRTILALAALEDLELFSIDISQAFMNGDLDVEMYMQQPEGFKRGNPGDVLKLAKGIYGLKQAGRLWNHKLHTTLLQMDFQRLKSDASVYLYAKDDVRCRIRKCFTQRKRGRGTLLPRLTGPDVRTSYPGRSFGTGLYSKKTVRAF